MRNFSDVLKQLDDIYESMSKQSLTEAPAPDFDEETESSETDEITGALDDTITNVLSTYSEAIEEAGEVYVLKASEAAKAKAAVIKAIANFFDLLKAKE